MLQIFGIELISSPRPPIFLGVEGLLSTLDGADILKNGFETKTIEGITRGLLLLRKNLKTFPKLIILSGHGEKGLLKIGTSKLELTELLMMNPGLFRESHLHLSYCESMMMDRSHVAYLLSSFMVKTITGYHSSPTWEESFSNDRKIAVRIADKYKTTTGAMRL